ncbi:MAG: EAL domain-containing protein [Candidatus Dormiibacterota bacterium]
MRGEPRRLKTPGPIADPALPDTKFARAVFGNMHDLVAVCDPRGRVTLANRAMETFAGVDADASLPEHWSAYGSMLDIDGRPIGDGAGPVSRALRGEIARDTEMIFVAPSGERRTMIVDSEPLFDAAGELLGAITVWHDISDRRHPEDQHAFHAQRGAGHHPLFTGTMPSLRLVGIANEASLRSALINGEFYVDYQPKVSLVTDRTVGVEALLRWLHPERGLIGPLDFIPLAEESGIIVQIGAWVLEQVCREAIRWRTALPGGQPLQVAVNVSPRQFESGLAETFGGIIGRSGIDPATVCLEVTESMVMQDAELAVATLRELKSLGLSISVDDFGTGFSSLAYLKRFPLDELKIDKSFVDGLGRDFEATAIVAAVMGMAHALDLRVVAEGVETADQVVRLRTLGCDEAQGFFFARPASAAAIDERLSAESRAYVGGTAQQGRKHSESAHIGKVLVVDDADDVRQLARSSLAAVGFEVREAASGEDAVTMARHFKPDCVVLDVNLPGISGFDVCRILRDDPANQRTTIVILTGDAGPSEKVMAFSLEADDYMVKPFSPRDLVSRVTAAIRRRGESFALSAR